MYVKLEPFGYLAFGETIGSAWLSLVEIITKYGELDDDEGRKRLCLQNIRLKSLTQQLPDRLIDRYGNKKNVEEIVNLTFHKDIMHDFDVVPSFSDGSQSYYARVKGWNIMNFVIKRLSEIPESKKAVMSFIREEDYKRTLDRPRDDYLPCITTIQFRLIKMDDGKGWYMNTLFTARSIDAFQKANGNLVAISLISTKIAEEVAKNLKVPVWAGSLDGMITDAHIYQETIPDAKKVIKDYKKFEMNNF